MSEYFLLVISTICAVVGALADVAIVVLMVRGESAVTDKRRRYWPWLLAMAMVTVATAAPAYLTYQLATGGLAATAQAGPPAISTTPFELVRRDHFDTREIFRPILMNSMRQGKPHPVEVIAALESQTFAVHLAGWIAMSGWPVREHGCQNCWVGVPAEHALKDGVTISAHEDCVDAESLRFALAMIGIEARPVLLPPSDNRNYPIIEIGHLPQ